jgi:type IV pilus assembly protein PilO
MQMKSTTALLWVGVSVGALALPVASYFLVFRPQNAEINRAKGDVEHMRNLLTRLQEEAAKNADFERANQELAANIQTIERRLPTNQEVDAVVRQVSDLAVAAGMTSPAVKTNKPMPAGLYMEQPLEMETQGSFIGFHTFLAQLEKLPRVTRIHEMKLAAQLGDEHELKATFTLSIYYQDDNKSDEVASANGQ